MVNLILTEGRSSPDVPQAMPEAQMVAASPRSTLPADETAEGPLESVSVSKTDSISYAASYTLCVHAHWALVLGPGQAPNPYLVIPMELSTPCFSYLFPDGDLYMQVVKLCDAYDPMSDRPVKTASWNCPWKFA